MSKDHLGNGEGAAAATANDAPSAGRLARPIPEAAKRALAEAEERRRRAAAAPTPPEVDGRGGLDPARYGDWEVKGIAADF
jgi:hypothetical protein